MNQRLWEMNKGYDSIRQWNGHGQEVTGNALGWTFQETVMGYVPVDQLNLESSGTVWNFFLHLFEGSFGNTVHEQAVGDSPIPSYAIAGSAWKKYMDNHVNYGYRILQKKPIAYADIPFGYVDGKEVTRLGTVGCQFASDLMDRKNIGSVNAKPYAILFLSRHLQAQTGISIHPAQLRETGYKRSWFAGIGSVGGPTDFAVGYEASENERRIEGSVHFTF